MAEKRVIVIKTDTYKKSLHKLKDSNVILSVEKKVDKLIENPNLAIPMSKQHWGICEIKVTDKYRVYCIKKEKTIILFLLGPAMHHKDNYGKNKEYQKLFNELRKISDEYGENLINKIEDSINKSLS